MSSKAVLHLRWDVTGPESEVIAVKDRELIVQVGNVVDQAQILQRVQVRHGRRVDMQGREGENTGCLPLSDGCLDLGRPHEIRLIGGGRAVCIGHLYVVVRTADLVLGTVAAEIKALSVRRNYKCASEGEDIFCVPGLAAYFVCPYGVTEPERANGTWTYH